MIFATSWCELPTPIGYVQVRPACYCSASKAWYVPRNAWVAAWKYGRTVLFPAKRGPSTPWPLGLPHSVAISLPPVLGIFTGLTWEYNKISSLIGRRPYHAGGERSSLLTPTLATFMPELGFSWVPGVEPAWQGLGWSHQCNCNHEIGRLHKLLLKPMPWRSLFAKYREASSRIAQLAGQRSLQPKVSMACDWLWRAARLRRRGPDEVADSHQTDCSKCSG